jgi:nitroimidazol reductase NimA-like FMN-containing flavoprotein (pyridoxamine 5'-phosphate oxidase superfamily)
LPHNNHSKTIRKKILKGFAVEIRSNQIRKQKFAVYEKEKIESIIQRATVCRLGLMDGENPYIVPMNFGYESGSLYFHMGQNGRKIEYLLRSPNIAFEIDTGHVIRSEDACAWDMQYECVMGHGTALFLNDREQKMRALNIIMKHYSDREWTFPLAKVDKTVILQVSIETVSAKSNMKESI